ncbi:MAG: BamA/TamA family outer membrane protein [Bacteroidales bacterium]|nr:BamA/TamA family outer membrane protein [Bacteroidales bacterium]
MKLTNLYRIFVLLMLSLSACSPIVKNGHLLVSNVVVCDDSSIDVADPQSYIKQIPSKTILGVPLHARIYVSVDSARAESIRAANQRAIDSINAARRDYIKRMKGQFRDSLTLVGRRMEYYQQMEDSRHVMKKLAHDSVKYLRKYNKFVERDTFFTPKTKKFSLPLFWQGIGEKPVVYNSKLTMKSRADIVVYMQKKGYYDADVAFSEQFRRRKAYITYDIHAGKPITIESITYNVPNDDTLAKYILADTAKSLLKNGANLDLDVLQSERSRISDALKNCGYYAFRKDYVTYTVDTTVAPHKASVVVDVQPVTLDNGHQTNHRRYYVSQVYIYPNYNVSDEMRDRDLYYDSMKYYYMMGRTRRNNLTTFVYQPDTFLVKPRVIAKEVFVKPGSMYNQVNVNDTYKHLSAFNIYKMVEIKFDDHTQSRDSLNCNIYLTTNKQQEYILGIGSTNSSGNIGASSSLTYRHKNIFNGAETFDLKFALALESQRNFSEGSPVFHLNTQEYQLESRLYFPRMLAPRRIRRFVRDLTPRTYLQLHFNYRDRPDYTRSMITTNLAYQLQNSPYLSTTITPVRLSSIRITDTDSAFVAWLNRLYIKDSYQDHFILGSGYSLVFNNQANGRRFHNYLKFNLSWAGNLMTLVSDWCGRSKNESGSYTVPWLNTTYAQFVKADLDFRHYITTLGNKNTFVWRLFAGIGIPYGNIGSMPFTEQYFSGGANSLRAWQIRSVGPGSFVNTETDGLSAKYPNLTSDMKLEANMEYRFKIFWVVEGAWFFDAGNIWSINKDEKREGSQFNFKSFYKEVALGTGLGLRLDFDFFLLRTDFGLKLRDPSLPEGNRWIPHEDHKFIFRGHNWAFSLGIGYPF